MIHVKVGMHPTQPVEPEKVEQPKPEEVEVKTTISVDGKQIADVVKKHTTFRK